MASEGAEWFKGRTALVTGASMGIGRVFVEALAARGVTRVVIVARSAGKLEELAATMRAKGVEVRVVAQDLSAPGAAERVWEDVKAAGWTIDLLVNNAGFGTYGRFGEQPLPVIREEINLNVTTLVELTHLFLPHLIATKGGVIQVASTAAFQPLSHLAVYAATKAFVLSFSEALWAEYRPQGVRVLALCPGATDTPFFERAGEKAAVGVKATPEDVVEVGLAAFVDGRSHVIEGWKNYLLANVSRLLPRETLTLIAAQTMRPDR